MDMPYETENRYANGKPRFGSAYGNQDAAYLSKRSISDEHLINRIAQSN